MGNVIVCFCMLSLNPHCCYMPTENHLKGPFSHVDIAKDFNVMLCIDIPALVAPPELPQLEPLQLTVQQDWVKAIGNVTADVSVTPHCLYTNSDIVDSRAHICWPGNRAVSSDNPRSVIKGSVAP